MDNICTYLTVVTRDGLKKAIRELPISLTLIQAKLSVMIFTSFLPFTFFFPSPKRPLIQLHSTMTCFHTPYLILSYVPFSLSYLISYLLSVILVKKAITVILDYLG